MNRRRVLCACLLGMVGLGIQGRASAAYTFWREMLAPPSLNDLHGNAVPYYFEEPVGCYDSATGVIVNCTFKYTLVGLDPGNDPNVVFQSPLTFTQIYGGHEHNEADGTHPYFYSPSSTGNVLEASFTATNVSHPTRYSITGNTGEFFPYPSIVWAAPVAAGAVWVDESLTFPWPFYTCVFYCNTYDSQRLHETVLTGLFDNSDPNQLSLQELTPVVPLPSSSDPTAPDYIVSRNLSSETAPLPGDPGHGDNDNDDESTWGTAYTIQQLKIIAKEYRRIEPLHGQLSINDVSLLEGGLFDVHDDWNLGPKTPAHLDHRVGRAFDVNQQDNAGQKYPCNGSGTLGYAFTILHVVATEQDLGQAVGGTNVFPHFTPVHCEGAKYHVNINVYAYPVFQTFPPLPTQIPPLQ